MVLRPLFKINSSVGLAKRNPTSSHKIIVGLRFALLANPTRDWVLDAFGEILLKSLVLNGYRGFEKHELNFRSLSVIVGRNNAGKSTIVEALRILSIITERIAGLSFHDPPSWTELPLNNRGVSPSLDGLGIQFDTVSHRYGDNPAEVTATFGTGESIHLILDRTAVPQLNKA